MIDLQKAFEQLKAEYLRFNDIDFEERPFSRRDLCAFARIDYLVTSEEWGDIIDSAGHDEIFLSVDCEELAQVATEEDILYLVRCGVLYNSNLGSLFLYV